METLRWLLTLVLGAGFVGLAMFNWRAFCTNALRAGDEPAAVPLVAGVLGILALWTCPLEGSVELWWVPLVLDFGSLPYPLWLAWTTARRRPS